MSSCIIYKRSAVLPVTKWLPSVSDTFLFLFQDKKIVNIYKPDSSIDSIDETVVGGLAVGGLATEAAAVDEEAPLIPSSRLSHVTRTQTGSLSSR